MGFQRNEKIDLIKGIGFLMVFMVHYNQMFGKLPFHLHDLLKYGQTGCQIFLMCSGFLIALSCEKGKLYPYRTYITKKAVALMPGYLLSIVIYTSATVIFGLMNVGVPFESNISVFGILSNALLLHGLVPEYNNTVVPGGWYVATQFILYALIPFVISVIKDKKLAKIPLYRIAPIAAALLSLLVSVFAISFDLFDVKNNSFFYYSIICQLPPFLLGITLFYDYKKLVEIKSIKLLIGFALFTLITFVFFVATQVWLVSLIPFTAGISFCFLFLLLNKVRTNKLERMLSKIGKSSYGCYLSHFVFAWYVPWFVKRTIDLSDSVLFVILLIPCVLTAVFVGIAFDRFIKKLGKGVTDIFLNKLKV